MKVRTITGTTLGARLAALGWGALTLLAPVAVSACSGPSSSSSTPIFTPSVSTSSATSGSATSTASSGNTATPGGTTSPVTPGVSTSTPATSTSSRATQTPAATATATVTTTATATPSSSRIPTAAPVTGGGGTAGLQGGLLFGLGGTAILAGAGSIAYRRRLTRNR